MKPGLFKNELLGAADPLITILFEGLWAMADREGRLQDRPLRICAEVFPYRRSVTEKRVDAWLTWLHKESFIARYEVDGRRYIQVLAFWKHQKPHSKEKASEIPSLSTIRHQPELSLVTDLGSGHAPTKVIPSTGKGSGEHALNPDSGILNPESSLRETRAMVPRGTNYDDSEDHEAWRSVQAIYPPGSSRQNWIGAERAARALVDNGTTWQELRDGVTRYAANKAATGDRVMDPQKFFTDEDRPWAQAWPIPPGKNQQRQDANLSVSRAWMSGDENAA